MLRGKSLRILYVLPIYPFAGRIGSAIRSSNIIRRLVRQHEVHVLCLGNDDSTDDALESVKDACASVERIPHSFSRCFGATLSVLRFRPYDLTIYSSRQMRKRLSEILPTLKPDIVYFSRYAGSQYATESSDSLQIVDQHDLSSNLWRISSRNADSFAVRLFSKFNLAITSQYERRIFGRVDGIVCVSNDEHEMTKRLVEAEKQMIVIPNGADVDYFSPANCDTDPATTVLFGAMSAIRNVQAAEYFARRVLPMIQHTHPDARFEIVGHNPASEVLALSRLRGVEVTGEVSDIRPYLARATVVVAPYFSGSGVKHKVPIAMAMAKASVLSTNAAQGLGICHGMHALVADETSEFASAVCRLLSDTEQRTRLGLAARELIVNQYSWDALAGKLERWLIQRHAERFGFEANRHNLLL